MRGRVIWTVLVILVAGCIPEPSPVAISVTPTPVISSLLSPAPVPYPISAPSATPLSSTSSPTVPSRTLPDCMDIAPFAPECPDQSLPPRLVSTITFTSAFSSGPVNLFTWSPNGSCLAYGVDNDREDQVHIRCQPDFRLANHWSLISWPVTGLPTWSGLVWSSDSRAVLFIFNRNDASSIGLARLGESGWKDLLPGEKARMGVNRWKNFQDWLSETTLAFTHSCGTGCSELHLLDVDSGDLLPVPQAGEYRIASRYLFSPDRRWVAGNIALRAFPEAFVKEWPGPGKSVYFSSLFHTENSEVEFWDKDSLGVIVYPPGRWQDWKSLPHPDLYLWKASTGQVRLVARGAYRAVVAPTGDRLAVLFFGEPQSRAGLVEAAGSRPYLGLLDWPSGYLLAAFPVGNEGFSKIKSVPPLPGPFWSPDGKWLAFPLYSGGASLVDRNGNARSVLSTRQVEWMEWGGNGYLAMLVDGSVQLVRVLDPDSP